MDHNKFTKKKHALGFYQASPLPSSEELNTYYSEKYFQDCAPASYNPEYTADEKQYFYNFGIISQKIWQTRCPSKTEKKMIDIGCGEGFFAQCFYKEGWDIDLCDFSSFGLNAQHPHLSKFLSKGNIYERIDILAKEGISFDFINLSYVLEHVRDPLGLIDKIKKIMKKETLFRIQVPNDFSDFQDMLLKKKCTEETWFAPPDHLNYFTFATLRNLLENRGMVIVDMLTDFPIETFLHNPHSNYFVDRDKGPQANLSRIEISNFLTEKNLVGYVDYIRAAANIGFGRSIIVFAQLQP